MPRKQHHSQRRARPMCYIPTRDIHHCCPPIPTYPIVTNPIQLLEKYWTPQPSYLNAIGNDVGHPLHFMAYRRLQR